MKLECSGEVSGRGCPSESHMNQAGEVGLASLAVGIVIGRSRGADFARVGARLSEVPGLFFFDVADPKVCLWYCAACAAKVGQ